MTGENAGRASKRSRILLQDALPTYSRGGGASTTPLVTMARGATTFLNGITRFGPAAAIDHHVHNALESVVVVRGDAIVDIDGERTALRTLDTTLVPANIPHHFENASDSDEMWIFWTYASLDATRTIVATGAHGRIDAEHPADGDSSSDLPLEETLVHEIAEIEVIPGHESEFEKAVHAASPLFQSSRGARTLRLDRSHENPSHYRLVVGWDTVDDHLVGFRESPEFAEWRRLAEPHFAEPPRVHHVRNVFNGF